MTAVTSCNQVAREAVAQPTLPSAARLLLPAESSLRQYVFSGVCAALLNRMRYQRS
jgi:hypothetical protein